MTTPRPATPSRARQPQAARRQLQVLGLHLRLEGELAGVALALARRRAAPAAPRSARRRGNGPRSACSRARTGPSGRPAISAPGDTRRSARPFASAARRPPPCPSSVRSNREAGPAIRISARSIRRASNRSLRARCRAYRPGPRSPRRQARRRQRQIGRHLVPRSEARPLRLDGRRAADSPARTAARARARPAAVDREVDVAEVLARHRQIQAGAAQAKRNGPLAPAARPPRPPAPRRSGARTGARVAPCRRSRPLDPRALRRHGRAPGARCPRSPGLSRWMGGSPAGLEVA